MSCKDFKNKLLLYIKNDLSEKEKKRLEQHLSHCFTCHKELQELRKMDTYLLDHIVTETAPELKGIIKHKNSLKYVLATAAMLLIVSIFFLIPYSETGPEYDPYTWDEHEIMDLHDDYDRITYEYKDSFSFDDEITDDDLITNYIYSINDRIDYLTEDKL